MLYYGTLLPFMLFAIYYLFREKNKFLIFLTFPLIIQTLLHVLQWGLGRYRMPIDSFIIILGTYGIFIIVEKFLHYFKCDADHEQIAIDIK